MTVLFYLCVYTPKRCMIIQTHIYVKEHSLQIYVAQTLNIPNVQK